MKTYDEAVLKVAKEYAHKAHDSYFPKVNYSKVEMIAFIFSAEPDFVHAQVLDVFEQHRDEWWK